MAAYAGARSKIFRFTIYQVGQTKRFCFKKGRVPRKAKFCKPGCLSAVPNLRTADPLTDIVDTRKDSSFYNWSRRRRGGHFTFFNWRMNSAILKHGVLRTYHPYVRIYGHGDGSVHGSGHNW